MSATKAASRGGLYVRGLVCGVMAAIIPGVAVLLCVLMLPAIAGNVLDRRTRDASGMTMLLLSTASVLGPLRELWDAGLGIAAALDLCRPTTIALSWVAAATGWLIVEAAAVVAGQLDKAARNRRRSTLAAERAKLEEEWGRLVD